MANKKFLNKYRVLNIFSLILNAINIVLVALAINCFFRGQVGTSNGTNMDVSGVVCFRFFTNLSNIFCALTSLFVIPYNIKTLITGKEEESKWAHILKYIGTVAVTVTFLTVVCFLGPTQGFDIMFEGPCLYLHLICPLLAMFSFICFELKNKMKFVESLYGLISVVAYGIVYAVMVLGVKHWPDYYGFATTIPWYASVILMPLATFAISAVIFLIRHAIRKQAMRELK